MRFMTTACLLTMLLGGCTTAARTTEPVPDPAGQMPDEARHRDTQNEREPREPEDWMWSLFRYAYEQEDFQAVSKMVHPEEGVGFELHNTEGGVDETRSAHYQPDDFLHSEVVHDVISCGMAMELIEGFLCTDVDATGHFACDCEVGGYHGRFMWKMEEQRAYLIEVRQRWW